MKNQHDYKQRQHNKENSDSRNYCMKTSSCTRSIKHNTGFSLVEISIVLVIIGLIIGSISPLLISRVKQEKLREAKAVVNIARDEVIGFARMNQRLPTRGEFALKIGQTIDPWNEELFYLPAQNTTWSEPDLCEALDNDESEDIQGFQIKLPGRQDLPGVAFIVGSKGANYQSNTYLDETLIKSSTEEDGLSNEGAEGTVIIKSYGENDREGNRYDDIVEFVTILYLYNRVCP